MPTQTLSVVDCNQTPIVEGSRLRIRQGTPIWGSSLTAGIQHWEEVVTVTQVHQATDLADPFVSWRTGVEWEATRAFDWVTVLSFADPDAHFATYSIVSSPQTGLVDGLMRRTTVACVCGWKAANAANVGRLKAQEAFQAHVADIRLQAASKDPETS